MADSFESAQQGGQRADEVAWVLGIADRAVLSDGYSLQHNEQESPILQGPSCAIQLNETACEILGLCREPRSVQGIVDDVLALYVGAPPADIERSVREFLDSALGKGWIERSPRTRHAGY